jgi:hypothetical protein
MDDLETLYFMKNFIDVNICKRFGLKTARRHISGKPAVPREAEAVKGVDPPPYSFFSTALQNLEFMEGPADRKSEHTYHLDR